uniref:IrrE N-terminal-like domain-containing protein n=1 Tax=Candidatus Kentrum sp. MB TaxID=2138164 RepID=A0A450X300_9GAMM|nr:MAG: protein of unknown function (DUF955) [Candidatus Kentron sp. MB]VFK27971.1 MAG: protein of unknown function (DUF955) [Candidatus Kentron sp. MB]VFK74486.1 MAG: protein of unknown function (DUF955) [Candidatus Kentron sp. MB]
MNNFLNYHGFSAKELLEELENNFEFSISAPIDVDKIVVLLGIILDESMNFDEISTAGSVSIVDGRSAANAKIWINPIENSYPPRRRFTIAHEIGHLILHIKPEIGIKEFIDTKIKLNRRDYYWDKKEYEANNFAAQLLMPVDLINGYGKKIISSYKKRTEESKVPMTFFIEEMAEQFDVSETAMRFRLKNIGAIK